MISFINKEDNIVKLPSIAEGTSFQSYVYSEKFYVSVDIMGIYITLCRYHGNLHNVM
jgi:hypothetical protein